MPSPFPGMDPWLEDPTRWPGVHNRLIAALDESLNRDLRGRYLVRIGERVVVEAPWGADRFIEPDAVVIGKRTGAPRAALAEHDPAVWIEALPCEVKEWTLEIREVHGRKLITAIEVLSPSNKASAGEGRDLYRKKQEEVLNSSVHLVEIDLLRGGRWTVAVPESPTRSMAAFDYLVSVSRADNREGFEVYPIKLQDRLPRIAIPLAGRDPDAVADLQALLDRCYDNGQYDFDLDYARSPVPHLSSRQSTWARRILRRGKRRRAR